MKWEEHRLSQCCEITAGFAFSSSSFTDNNEDIPLVKGENLHQGYIDWDKAKRWPQNLVTNRIEKFDLIEGDIVIAMDRPWIEAGLKWSWIKHHEPSALLVQRVSRLRSYKGVDQTFLRYIIGSKIFEDYIKPIVTGVNVPHISGKQIGDFKLLLPPLPTQRKIAAILSTYDELIENNNRRIAILEKMAEELYREWFVRLRFPGHEQVKMVKGVPEGWKAQSVNDSFEILGGGTPSTKESSYWAEGDVNWYTPTDLTAFKTLYIDESSQKITETGLKNSSAKLFPSQSIMMTSRATIGEIAINTKPSSVNQGFIVCLPNDTFPLEYLYFWLRFNKELFIQEANGATFLEITKGRFKKIPIMKPNIKVTMKFSEIVAPIFLQIDTALKTVRKLKMTRDLLLPRLISGKLDIEALDITFPKDFD